jgi:hypothetical protein
MAEHRLFNLLELSYAHLSNYDFVMVKDELIIKKIINSGRWLYIIAQRTVLTFEKFYIDSYDPINQILKFKLHQKGSSEILLCDFHYFRRNLMFHLGLDVI